MSLQTFEQLQADAREVTKIGDALALTANERGDRLTDDERGALTHWSMFGSDGYPVFRCGRKWTITHPTFKGGGLYNTKREAVRGWEILIAKWIRMTALERRA